MSPPLHRVWGPTKWTRVHTQQSATFPAAEVGLEIEPVTGQRAGAVPGPGTSRVEGVASQTWALPGD